MADTIIGKVLPTLKGEYQLSTQYVLLDIVTYHGSSFICKADTTTAPPSDDWVMMSAKGDAGTAPHIDPTSGNWFVGNVDTGVHAQGEPGKAANFEDYAKRSELTDFAKKDEISKLRSDVDTNFAKKDEIPKVDLSGYAKLTDIPSLAGLLKKADLPDYAKKTDIPSLKDYVKEDELSAYAKKDDVPAPVDLSGYALKTDIPSLTGYAKLTDIPSVAGMLKKADLDGYALKTDIPSLDGYVKETELADYVKTKDLPAPVDLSDYAKKDDIPTIPADLVHSSELDSLKSDTSSALETAQSAKIEADQNKEALANKANNSDIPDISDLATKSDVTSAQSAADSALSNANKAQSTADRNTEVLDSKADRSELPDISGLATKSEVQTAVANATPKIDSSNEFGTVKEPTGYPVGFYYEIKNLSTLGLTLDNIPGASGSTCIVTTKRYQNYARQTAELIDGYRALTFKRNGAFSSWYAWEVVTTTGGSWLNG